MEGQGLKTNLSVGSVKQQQARQRKPKAPLCRTWHCPAAGCDLGCPTVAAVAAAPPPPPAAAPQAAPGESAWRAAAARPGFPCSGGGTAPLGPPPPPRPPLPLRGSKRVASPARARHACMREIMTRPIGGASMLSRNAVQATVRLSCLASGHTHTCAPGHPRRHTPHHTLVSQ